MKRTIQTVIVSVIICIIAASLFSGCSQSQGREQAASTVLSSTNDVGIKQTENNITIDKYEEKIAYYTQLTESLKAELINIKEENYITTSSYTLTIRELEKEIEKLRQAIEEQEEPLSNDTTPTKNEITKPNAEPISSDKSSFSYKVTSDGVTILGYKGNNADVIIPDTIDGVPVRSIGDSAFKGTNINSVVIPEGVFLIDWFAFANCNQLLSVSIPSSVGSISYGAFENCPANLTLICKSGSYAESYAQSWGIRTETDK